MNFKIDKNKFWWVYLPSDRGWRVKLYLLVIVIVLLGVNIYLYVLRKSMYEFIVGEVELDGRRIEQIRVLRDYRETNPHNPQPKFGPIDY